MASVACAYSKEIKGGALHAFAASKYQKVGVAYEANIAVAAVVVLPDRAFLTSHLM